MPSTYTNWTVQCDLAPLPVKINNSGKWKVYAEIKVIKKGAAGSAFTAGVYDGNTKTSPAVFQLNLNQVQDENYHLYFIGSIVPAARQYVYVMPTKNPENAQEVIVDRFLLVRDK
jgi:hypothetical protein